MVSDEGISNGCDDCCCIGGPPQEEEETVEIAVEYIVGNANTNLEEDVVIHDMLRAAQHTTRIEILVTVEPLRFSNDDDSDDDHSDEDFDDSEEEEADISGSEDDSEEEEASNSEQSDNSL